MDATNWISLAGLAAMVISSGLYQAWRLGRIEQRIIDMDVKGCRWAADRRC
jgi:hypothetical protein